MSIDEAMKNLKRIHRYEKVNQFYAFSIDSIDVAMDTMRKYQQIEQIWDKWHVDMSVKTNVAMAQIGKVLKDGKIDKGGNR